MRSVALCSVLIAGLCPALCQAALRNVAVLVNFERPHSAVSVESLQAQLQDLLLPSGIAVQVMLKSDLPDSPQFSELVVFEMKGSCSMDVAPVPQPIDERGPLGLAYESNGQVLHFGEVECDRVRRCLQRITKGVHPEQHQSEYRAALSAVVAHEIYHMIAGATQHTKDGLTKASLSARELLDGELSLPAVVRQALRR